MTRQPSRTHEGLRQALVGYHNLRQGGRLRQPEESLGVQPTPIEEATWERPSDLRMDAETALRKSSSITFENAMITFEYLSAGGNDQARGIVARRWGIKAPEVGFIERKTINSMVEYLTGRRE